MLSFGTVSSKYYLNLLAISTSEVTKTFFSMRLTFLLVFTLLPKRDPTVFQNFLLSVTSYRLMF